MIENHLDSKKEETGMKTLDQKILIQEEMIENHLDSKKEEIEIEEMKIKMKGKENPLVLRVNLAERKRFLKIRKKDFQEKNEILEINFHQ